MEIGASSPTDVLVVPACATGTTPMPAVKVTRNSAAIVRKDAWRVRMGVFPVASVADRLAVLGHGDGAAASRNGADAHQFEIHAAATASSTTPDAAITGRLGAAGALG